MTPKPLGYALPITLTVHSDQETTVIYGIMNNDGKLAISGTWSPDYDKPIMGRLVYTSRHKYDPAWADFRVEATGCDDLLQYWSITHPVTRSKLTFSTPVRGEYVTGAVIKPPRKSKNQVHPWRWEAGKWTKSAVQP